MFDPPSSDALLKAVRDFLRDHVLEDLTDQKHFHALVAVNVLDIARREIRDAAAMEEREASRLRAILKTEEKLSSAEANRRLCDAIARGDITLETPGLREHLWATVMDKLSVDQPRYAAYRKEAEREED